MRLPAAEGQKNQAQLKTPSCGTNTSPLLRAQRRTRAPRLSPLAQPAAHATQPGYSARHHAPGAHADRGERRAQRLLVDLLPLPRLVELQKHRAGARLQRRRLARSRRGRASRRHQGVAKGAATQWRRGRLQAGLTPRKLACHALPSGLRRQMSSKPAAVYGTSGRSRSPTRRDAAAMKVRGSRGGRGLAQRPDAHRGCAGRGRVRG